MKEEEMRTVARLIVETLGHRESEKHLQEVREEVSRLCRNFPLYAERIERA